MAIGIAWWSVFTSLTGAVLTLPLMLAVRFFFGIGEGCFPSASWKMISTYFPSKERGRATAIQSTVNTLGPALAVVVAASIIGAFGWHMVLSCWVFPVCLSPQVSTYLRVTTRKITLPLRNKTGGVGC